MEDFEKVKTEEEITELVADALRNEGLAASAQDTGGGICCVLLERSGGGEIIWGTADFNWGASVFDEDGTPTSSIETECSSDTQDVDAIVRAIKEPSVKAGAARSNSGH